LFEETTTMTTITRSTRFRVHRQPIAAAFAQSVLRASAAAWTAMRGRSQVRRLAELDDHLLEDIGLSRADLEDARSVPIYSDPTVMLASRAGNTDPRRPRGRRGDRYGSFADRRVD
jgi:uncharacterized protein YjiS (DUF1127 family)